MTIPELDRILAQYPEITAADKPAFMHALAVSYQRSASESAFVGRVIGVNNPERYQQQSERDYAFARKLLGVA